MVVLRSALFYLWMGLTVVPWSLVLLLVSLVASRNTVWRVAVNWFGVVVWGCRVLAGVQVRVRGLENVPAQGTVVFLSKHQSTLETLLLPTLLAQPLAFVFKRELLRIPFFGWSMARLNMIHIDRDSRAASMKGIITQGCRLLQRGTSVIMFPEGTRIPRGERGTYQTAGTRLAVEAGVPVVPIAVTTARCWPRDSWCKHAGVVEVSFGAPIAAQGAEPRALMRQVEQWVESEMARLDPPPHV
ncbi:MAG: lysophospholipid acyltransferase family protein [Rhodoferax sp.]